MDKLLEEIKDNSYELGHASNNFYSYDKWVELEDVEELINKYSNPELSEDQCKVLDRLVAHAEHVEFNSFQAVFWLLNTLQYVDEEDPVRVAYLNLNKEERDIVLRVFILREESKNGGSTDE